MSFVTTQTFDVKDVRDELSLIDALIQCKLSPEALALIIRRRDVLTSQPVLKPYDQREA